MKAGTERKQSCIRDTTRVDGGSTSKNRRLQILHRLPRILSCAWRNCLTHTCDALNPNREPCLNWTIKFEVGYGACFDSRAHCRAERWTTKAGPHQQRAPVFEGMCPAQAGCAFATLSLLGLRAAMHHANTWSLPIVRQPSERIT